MIQAIVLIVLFGIPLFIAIRGSRSIQTEFGLIAMHSNGCDYVTQRTTKLSYRPYDKSYKYGICFFREFGPEFKVQVVHYFARKPLYVAEEEQQSPTYIHTPRGFCLKCTEKVYSGSGSVLIPFGGVAPLGVCELDLFVNDKFHSTIQYEVTLTDTPDYIKYETWLPK